jgi:hypothetical protein
MVELNDWRKHEIIHRDNIKSYELLLRQGHIREAADGYYYLLEDPEAVETALWKNANERLADELGITSVEKEIKAFIARLNEYNEVKDIAQALMGKIAELRQTTAKVIHEELGMGEH